MDTCVLHPPTNRVLSDVVIGGVAQRSRNAKVRGEQPYWSRYSVEPREYSPESTGRYYGMPDSQTSPAMDRKRKRQEPSSPTASTLMLLAESSSDAAEISAHDPLAEVVKQDWFIEQQKHLREIRRIRQIRYRKKQQDYMETLEDKNRALQQEIDMLEQRRSAVAAAMPSEKTLWNVAVEYFRLFRYGLRASDLSDRSRVSTASAQLDFLRSTMAPDVMYNAGRGVEAIMRNWTYFSLWFQDVEVELDGLQKSGADSLIARTSTTFTITERTLVKVFPHLCGKDADATGRRLAAKLLGQTIAIRGSTRFDWDSGYCRVTSVISESDMLTPILRVLGSLEYVSLVFEKSLISLTPYRCQSRETSGK
ncbi:hypothetical protein JG687_00015541 [Phytophthora cactorum]|uniref:BZIP domain-containing protein n=1 Tax=Phytophthora cactorum TaxID=29920 RepID=A0A8T1TUQ5_9STRA|nr:hypothetical protein PC120_g22301 [Phytophthora cactorum]KAG3045133.1 hypothetical protein PC121_g21469 [Phytophthora cactorum]KAG6948337.1 hypothetical protein JG687_00015541 [Phytophthora cactorum]